MRDQSKVLGRVRPGDNPFRSGGVDALVYRTEPGEWAALVRRWAAAGYRGALVGPHGHGKSTLMRRLVGEAWPPERPPEAPPELSAGLSSASVPAGAMWHVVEAERSRLPAAVRRRVKRWPGLLAIDGYDRLRAAERWRLRRRRGPTLVTSHTATGLPLLRRCETTPALLGQIIDELSPAVRAALPDAEVEALHARHRGDVRLALREMYDRAGAGEFGTLD